MVQQKMVLASSLLKERCSCIFFLTAMFFFGHPLIYRFIDRQKDFISSSFVHFSCSLEGMRFHWQDDFLGIFLFSNLVSTLKHSLQDFVTLIRPEPDIAPCLTDMKRGEGSGEGSGYNRDQRVHEDKPQGRSSSTELTVSNCQLIFEVGKQFFIQRLKVMTCIWGKHLKHDLVLGWQF